MLPARVCVSNVSTLNLAFMILLQVGADSAALANGATRLHAGAIFAPTLQHSACVIDRLIAAFLHVSHWKDPIILMYDRTLLSLWFGTVHEGTVRNLYRHLVSYVPGQERLHYDCG